VPQKTVCALLRPIVHRSMAGAAGRRGVSVGGGRDRARVCPGQQACAAWSGVVRPQSSQGVLTEDIGRHKWPTHDPRWDVFHPAAPAADVALSPARSKKDSGSKQSP
jgi:hypothetical protein